MILSEASVNFDELCMVSVGRGGMKKSDRSQQSGAVDNEPCRSSGVLRQEIPESCPSFPFGKMSYQLKDENHLYLYRQWFTSRCIPPSLSTILLKSTHSSKFQSELVVILVLVLNPRSMQALRIQHSSQIKEMIVCRFILPHISLFPLISIKKVKKSITSTEDQSQIKTLYGSQMKKSLTKVIWQYVIAHSTIVNRQWR